MKQPNENLIAKFERLATHGRDIAPQQGYIKEIEAATNRGRDIIDAGKRGIESFPPAHQMLAGNK
jgi:hypothetical protein